MEGLFIVLIIAGLETAAVLAFYFWPDKYGWKKWVAGAFLFTAAVCCVYFPLSEYLERSRGGSINEDACVKAEELIRSGKRMELAISLKIEWFSMNMRKLDFVETANFFRAKIQVVEAGK